MQPFRVRAAGTCLMFAAGGWTAATAQSPQPQIEAVMSGMGRAAKAHDAGRFMGAFQHSPRLTFVFNGEVIRGWTALHARQVKWWRNGTSDVVYSQTGPTEFVSLAPNVWVTTQTMSSHRTGLDGKVAVGTFVVTSIWRKAAEGWQIVYGHESWAKPRE